MSWDRVEPAEPCKHPDGHEPIDVMGFASTVPKLTLCVHCSERYTITLSASAD